MRPEFYQVASTLASKYHMSQEQIVGAVITVANELFGRKDHGEWKAYNFESPTDKNTLPAMSNTRRTEPYIEAMALSLIVDEMMDEENETAVVYANDGSGMSGVGKYIVQSLTINGKKRTLPTFGISTETRDSLSDLMKDTVRILSISTRNKYSEQEILRKVNFVMTDSTSHNLKVIEKVCEDLSVDKVPSTLLCNVHPLMMFQNKIKQLCQMLHDALGTEKITNCFMVDVDFRNESFVIKALKCLSNFISNEYSAKPWNRHSHFSAFIKPKKNMSISLKDHRFNRLMDCSLALLYHFDDVASYLDKFTSINNGITVLDRSFLDMDILKPIFAAISLLGLHITRPFHTLIINKETNYSTLLRAFPLLYQDLTEVRAENYVTVEQVASFISPDVFKESLPDKNLLDHLSSMMVSYKSDITKFLDIALQLFAEGFSLQRGAIFGFGPAKDNSTDTVLKICSLSADEVLKMDQSKVQVHNLGEENTVGCVNYEIGIRGKSNLESASRKIVLNKCSDLLKKVDLKKLRTYRKEALEIKKVKSEWNLKMKALEEEGYSAKEILNTKKDANKLKDLQFLKDEIPPGPFTNADAVSRYVDDSNIKDDVKNKRLYIEIRYAKNTSLSLKETSSVFRLRTKHQQNLTSEEYADNLMQYLNNTRKVGNISADDLSSALLALRKPGGENQSDNEDTPQVGEHVAVVTHDEESEKNNWVLGIVESMVDDNSTRLSLMVSSKAKRRWTFPEEAEIRIINHERIFMRNITVTYCQTAKICCTLNAEIIGKLDNELDQLI